MVGFARSRIRRIRDRHTRRGRNRAAFRSPRHSGPRSGPFRDLRVLAHNESVDRREALGARFVDDRDMPMRPVRMSSWIPCGRQSSWNESSSSGVPVTSKTTESGPRSTTRPPKAVAVAISSARLSGVALTFSSRSSRSTASPGGEVRDPEHVDQLVDLLLDLLERVLLAVHAQGDARDAGPFRRADREGVDVEAAPREHRRDPRQRTGLVLDHDAQGALHRRAPLIAVPPAPRAPRTRPSRERRRRRGSSGSTARTGRRGSRRRPCVPRRAPPAAPARALPRSRR